jgi:hypothetical protein
MVRKMVIALAAVAIVTAGSTLDASARGGMGHGGGGGVGHGGGFGGGFSRGGGFSHGGGFSRGGGGFSRSAVAHSGRFAGVRHFGFRDRSAFRHRFDGRHRFFRNRFAFVGAAFPYGYYDSCYTRVWTPWGWRWQSVCY